MKDFVIYTVMTGGYNDILQPNVTDERFDYVLFSNDFEEKQIGVWQVRPIPAVVDLSDNKRLSRYPKSHPEMMLAEYTASLYMDANLQILDKWVYERFIELAEKKVDYAGIKLVLTGRDCIYDHAYDMCNMRVVHDYDALKQLHALYKLRFPRHFGLNENNIIFRSHTELMCKVDEEWWWWIKNYSFRDQFSYMYCLWKYGVSINYFLPVGEDAGNGIHIRRIEHNKDERVAKKKWLKLGFWEERRRKVRAHYQYCNEKHLQVWHRLYKSDHYKILNFLWGVCVFILDIPNIILRKVWKKL